MSDEKKTRAPRLNPDDVIRMAKDADGVAYGPDNNPRREGAKSHEIFSKYRDGLTVKEALEAGLKPVDIRWDVRLGHITLDEMPRAEKPVKEPKAKKAKKGAETEAAAA